MRKVLAYFLVLLCLAALVISQSSELMRVWENRVYARNHVLWSDRYTYGDLYGLSYLPTFKIPHEEAFIQPKVQARGNHHLSIIGDSYFYSYLPMQAQYFHGVQHLEFISWSKPKALKPLSGRPNRLLIEVVERNAFVNLRLSKIKADFYGASLPQESHGLWGLNAWIQETFYHPNQESQLAHLIFGTHLWSKFKEGKAAWNYQVFDRVDPGVQVSQDGQFLYLKETLDPKLTSSSFYPYSAQELQALVMEMNAIQDFFKTKGFQEVYFSILPNPVRVLMTEAKPTNRLFEDVAQHPQARFQWIDARPILQAKARSYFFQSDSHWNQAGAAAYLSYLNQVLAKP